MNQPELDAATKTVKKSPDDAAAVEALARALAAVADPRAELIRLGQVIVAEASPSKALLAAKEARAAWYEAHKATYFDRYGITDLGALRFHGGLVRGLLGDANTLAKLNPSIFADEPCEALEYALGQGDDAAALESLLSHGGFRSLTLYGACGDALYERLAGLPSIGALRSFSHNHSKASAHGLTKLVASPNWSALEALDLGYNEGLVDSVLAALAANDRLSALRSLVVSFSKSTDAGALDVATSPHFTLQSLDISWNALKLASTLAALASGPHREALRSLSVEQCPLKPAGVMGLLEHELPRLERLDVSSTRLGDAGLEAIASSTALPALRELRARANTIRGKGVAALVKSQARAALRVLDLNNNQLGKGAGAALGEKGALDQLEELNVSANTSFGGPGLSAIFASKGLRALTSLNAENTGATRADVEAWATSGALPSLAKLDLRYSQVGDAGAVAIAAAPGAERLRWLSLHGSGLSSAGVLALADSPRLAKLEHLDVSGASIDDAARSALKALPGLRSIKLGGGDVERLAELERAAPFVVLDLHRDL